MYFTQFGYSKLTNLIYAQENNSGETNDQMFPASTPEVCQMVFSIPVWSIWSCPKNYLSVRMS